MAFDAIAEFVVRAIAQFIAEVLFVGIFYWPGWVVLRSLTLGRYPPPQSQPHNREFVAIVQSRGSGLTFDIPAVQELGQFYSNFKFN